jgi:glycosyltransferase involved in cell wall biosynthesis
MDMDRIDDSAVERAPVRVLHVAEVTKGGVGTYLREIVGMQARDFGADAISLVVPASQLADLPTPPGVQVAAFKDSRNRLLNALRLMRVTRRLIAQRNPDIVHIHSTFAGALLRPVLAMTQHRARLVYCPHGWCFDRDSSALVRRGMQWVERLLAHCCDAIVCVSQHERTRGIEVGISSDKLMVAPNGMPAHAPEPQGPPLPWPEGALRLLFVGRFDRQKGIDVLFAALRELGDAAYAYIAGDSLREQLGAIPENSRYAGWLTPRQLESYYRSAEIVVMPSRWEGFPLVAVEAMRAGRPVLATQVGGLPEIVEHGETGWLIPADDPQALVAILKAVDRPQLAVMGEAARSRFVRAMSIEATHGKLRELYQGLCPSLVVA